MIVTQKMIDAGEQAYYAADKDNIPYLVQLIYEAMNSVTPRTLNDLFGDRLASAIREQALRDD